MAHPMWHVKLILQPLDYVVNKLSLLVQHHRLDLQRCLSLGAHIRYNLLYLQIDHKRHELHYQILLYLSHRLLPISGDMDILFHISLLWLHQDHFHHIVLHLLLPHRPISVLLYWNIPILIRLHRIPLSLHMHRIQGLGRQRLHHCMINLLG